MAITSKLIEVGASAFSISASKARRFSRSLYTGRTTAISILHDSFSPRCVRSVLIRAQARVVRARSAIVRREKEFSTSDRFAMIEQQRLFPLHITLAVQQQ